MDPSSRDCNTPSFFSDFNDLLWKNDPVMSSPLHNVAEEEIKMETLDFGEAPTILSMWDPTAYAEGNNLFSEELLNSSCAMSPTETMSPEQEVDFPIMDRLDLELEDGWYHDENEDEVEVHLAESEDNIDFCPSPTTSTHSDLDFVLPEPRRLVKKVGGGKNLPVASAKINGQNVVTVYPTQPQKRKPDLMKYSLVPNTVARRGTEKPQSQSGKCMNKNAVNARENRERKKRYVSELESAVHRLTAENKVLRERMLESDSVVTKLQKELKYTKSILANQGPLSSILSGLMESAPQLQIRAPLLSKFSAESNVVMIEEEKESEDTDRLSEVAGENETKSSEKDLRKSKRKRTATAKDFPPMKSAKKSSKPASSESLRMDHTYNRTNVAAGGICLHISHDDVSMQMCADCSVSAQESLKTGH